MKKRTTTSPPLTRAYLDQALKRVATKEDLKRFATKEDLKHLATKREVGRIRYDLLRVKQDVAVLKATMVTRSDLDKATDEIRKGFSTLQSSVVGFMGRTKRVEDEFTALRHSHKRLQDLLVKKQVITEQELAAA